MYELWMQNLTQNGKDSHLAPSTCKSPLNVASWIEFCWRASIAPRHKQRATLQGLLLRFGSLRRELPRSPSSTPLWDAAPIIKDVVPKARSPLGLSGSARFTAPQIIGMGDGGVWRGIPTEAQSEVTLPSFLPGVFQLSPPGLPWAGLCTKVFFVLLARSPWITMVICLLAYIFPTPLPLLPHLIRSNAAWDWFVQRAKQPKRLGTAEFTLNLGGGKMSRAGTKGIQ